MTSLPIDVLLHVIQFVDHPRDLLAFALTARVFHAAIVPQHIDYRHIACSRSYGTGAVWQHLLETPYACSHVRYLNMMDGQHKWAIPRVCKTSGRSGRHSDDYNLDAVQALSKMSNLKVLKFFVREPKGEHIYAISDAVKTAGCRLEEMEMHFDVQMDIERYLRENNMSKSSKESSLFYDHMPYLRKFAIVSYYSLNSGIFVQMLVNAPNLTHMNITLSPPHTLLSCHWINLRHLGFHSQYPQGNTTGPDYISQLQTFFSRHSKLITLSVGNALIPGWAIESDDFLPDLKSLGISTSFETLPTTHIITPSIAARLAHLDMSSQIYSSLKGHRVTLPNLESCRYWHADPGESIQDLVEIMPNIRKLYMLFGVVPNNPNARTSGLFGFNGSDMRYMTTDEVLERVPFFSGFKHLRVFLGLLDNIDISMEDSSLLKILYEFPSLLYTRAKIEDRDSLPTPGSHELHFLRLHRDPTAKTIKYERERRCPQECDMGSWGGFYERSPSVTIYRGFVPTSE